MFAEIIVSVTIIFGFVAAIIERVKLRNAFTEELAHVHAAYSADRATTATEISEVIASARADAKAIPTWFDVETGAKADAKSIEGKIEALITKVEAEIKKVL